MGISLRKRHFVSLGALVAAATVALVAAAQARMNTFRLPRGHKDVVGVDADKTSGSNYGPDGKLDGHWRMEVLTAGTVDSIDLYALDANGNKTTDHWSTKDPAFFLLAVEVNGKPVNTGHVDTLGPFPAGTVLDLYGSLGHTQFGAQDYEIDGVWTPTQQPTQPSTQPPTQPSAQPPAGTTGPCAYTVRVQVYDQPSPSDFDVCIQQ